MANNYTLGRGRIFFARFEEGTTKPKGERYIGNTPEFNLTIEEEELEHFNSDAGVNEKDDSISLSTSRSGSLTTDNIDPKNVALFFFGSEAAFTVAGGAVTGEEVNGAEQGLEYQLGTSVSDPSGARALQSSTVAVTDSTGSTTFVEGDDYTVDYDLGRLAIVEGGGIADGTDLLVDYTTQTSSREQIISGATPVEGAMRYIANNPKGDNIDYYFPYVKVSPNGDYALKGDEWQTIPFTLEILKLSDREAIYADGRPVVTP